MANIRFMIKRSRWFMDVANADIVRNITHPEALDGFETEDIIEMTDAFINKLKARGVDYGK